MALNITILWPTFPAGVPLTLAALRRAATISLSGTVSSGDIAPGAILSSLVTPGPFWFAVATGSGNDFAATYNPAVGSLVNGLVLAFQAPHANTGPATFNPNGLGVIPILKCGGSRYLDYGDIRANSMVEVRYNTADDYFEMLNLLGNAPKDYPMQGASAYMAGLSGLPPAPNAGDQAKYLRGDATWVDISSLITTGATTVVGSTLELFKLLNFH